MHQPWYERAACTQHDPEKFFPAHADEEATQTAKNICATCPVLGPCLKAALTTPRTEGIWGGTTETERRRFIKAARRKK